MKAVLVTIPVLTSCLISGLVLGLAGCVEAEPSTEESTQALTSIPLSPLRIANLASGLCADIPNGDFIPGADVQQFGCHTGDAQMWVITGSGDQVTANIRDFTRQWCWTVNGATDVKIQPCGLNVNSQKFTISGGNPTSGSMLSQIRSRLDNNCVQPWPTVVHSSGGHWHTAPCQPASAMFTAQQFVLLPLP